MSGEPLVTLTLTITFNKESDARNAAAQLENRVIPGRVSSRVHIARTLVDRPTAL